MLGNHNRRGQKYLFRTALEPSYPTKSDDFFIKLGQKCYFLNDKNNEDDKKSDKKTTSKKIDIKEIKDEQAEANLPPEDKNASEQKKSKATKAATKKETKKQKETSSEPTNDNAGTQPAEPSKNDNVSTGETVNEKPKQKKKGWWNKISS